MGIASLLLSAFSCRTTELDPVKKVNGTSALAPVPVQSSNLQALNVVYFVPKDSKPVDHYVERLTDILNNGKDFYDKWMKHWGYGDLSLRLNKDNLGKVKFIAIKGKENKDQYTYDERTGGYKRIQYEVSAYFKEHPQEKSSNHTLVILPAYYNSEGKMDVPFYGLGTWCFAVDYPGMKLENLGKDKDASGWIGGMMHELGHSLNLEHNAGREDENKYYGTSLMGSGNKTYGKNTYLTSADAAVLSVNSVFSTQTRRVWYTDPGFHLKELELSVSADSNYVTLSGDQISQSAVKALVVYYRTPEDKEGYKSVSQGKKYEDVNHNGKFSISVAMAGFPKSTWTNPCEDWS